MPLSRPASISIVSLYWVAVTVGSLALLFSIVTTLWGPRAPRAQASLAERHTWCVGQMALLSAELEHETQAALSAYSKPYEAGARRRQRWQRAWVERLGSVEGQCTQSDLLHDALERLVLLNQRYDAIVVAYQSAQENLHGPIESALKTLVDPWNKPTRAKPAAP